MKPDIVQYSVDIEYDGKIDDKKITKILEDAGLIVIGAAWKASWTNDDYCHGRKPYSSD